MTFLYKRSGTVWSKTHTELDWSVGERLQFRRTEHGSLIWRLKTPENQPWETTGGNHKMKHYVMWL